MVGGAPVAQTADVNAGLVFLGDIRGSCGDFSSFCLYIGNQLFGLTFLSKNLTQQLHRTVECLIKDSLGTGLQSNNRHTQLLLERVFLLYILKLRDDDVRAAGQNLFRFRSLCHGAANTAGGQGAEHIAVGQNVGSCHGVKHHRTLGQSGVVNVFHTAQESNIADVGVHSQSTGANADHTLVAAGGDGDLTANHIGNGDLCGFGCSSGLGCCGGLGCFRLNFGCLLLAAGTQGNQHGKRQQKRDDFFHCNRSFLFSLSSCII